MDGDGDSGNEIPLGGFYSAPDYINPMLSLVTAFGFTSLDVEIMDGRPTLCWLSLYPDTSQTYPRQWAWFPQ